MHSIHFEVLLKVKLKNKYLSYSKYHQEVLTVDSDRVLQQLDVLEFCMFSTIFSSYLIIY